MCFTDGLIEEHEVERTAQEVRAVVHSLSHTLKRARGGITTDDATLLLIEWRGAG